MSPELELLVVTAVTISFLHTLTGPDHYLPFIALSKARGWTLSRTIGWTLLCGCGHVWSSVALGLGGTAVGWSLSKLTWFESVRGGLASWMLLGFGILYLVWGLARAHRNHRHKHFDVYDDGELYVFEHRHGEVVAPRERHRVTPWVLFIVFLLGPCEPMIPLLYFPGAKNSLVGMIWLVAVYSLITILTMVVMVVLGLRGISLLRAGTAERYMHALGGFTIALCGFGMVFMNW